MSFFPHIKAFKEAAYDNDRTITYTGTVKLHGTNAGVLVYNGKVIPQSRTRKLSLGSDNMGFAAFIEQSKEEFLQWAADIRISQNIVTDWPIVFFGEWIGPGIQKGVATNLLPSRQFVMFGAASVVEDRLVFEDVPLPSLPSNNIYNIFEVPTYSVTVDFSDELSKAKAREYIEQVTLEVEEKCPWGVKFGLEGIGEGVVWTQPGPDRYHRAFKSKGALHRGGPREKKVQGMDIETLRSVHEFVNFACTEARLQQGVEALREAGKPISMDSARDYISWVVEDCLRECKLELDSAGLPDKMVKKALGARAAAFWKGVTNV